jgi:hypothetical protein
MGTSPAPPYVTLVFAIHKEVILDEFKDNLLLYHQFIDDALGIWVDTPGDNMHFKLFTKHMNEFGLTWEVNERSNKVDFMDLTIEISSNHLTTMLYEKAMNLYFHISPHSTHPLGVLSGLIYGNVFRIQRLSSEDSDRIRFTTEFYQRLLVRGYKSSEIKPLFVFFFEERV